MIRTVKKSDGTLQPFDPARLNHWAEWASNYGVNWSEVALAAVKRCHDGCSTADLQWAMIEACIDKQTQAHANMAGRLLIGNIYKEAFGGFRKIPTLTDFYNKMRALSLWEDMGYSASELNYLGLQINHYKDLNYGYAVVKQFRDKYAIKDALTKRVYESPQFMFMGMSLAVMQNQPKERRIQDVIKLYEYLSDLKINAPTPYLNGLRSKKSGYASCCVIKGDDTAESIGIAEHIAYTMTCKQAGIGIMLQTRSKGDGVRNKTIIHQGKIPYYACINTAVKANKQQCYSDDTEVMTASGWKLFKDLNESDLVGQIDDNGQITFVKPYARFSYNFEGELLNFKKQGIDLLVTENHKMVYRSVSYDDSSTQTEEGYQEVYASDWAPKRTHAIDFGTHINTVDDNHFELEPLLKLRVALAADGTINHNKDGSLSYRFGFKKLRKIKRLCSILDAVGLEYTTSPLKSGATRIYIKKSNLVLEKNLNWFYDMDFTHDECVALLRELGEWDGYYKSDSVIEFSSAKQSEINAVQWLCARAGVKSNTGVDKRCYIYLSCKSITGEGISISKVPYRGLVYCVEVPTHKLVVRRGGYTCVCGNSRGGSATVAYTILDPEIDDLLRLNNPVTPTQKQLKFMDYQVGMNESFLRRVDASKDWMLVSYADAPKLHEAIYKSYEEFEAEYDKVLNNPSIKKNIVSARGLAKVFLKNRYETGRIYPFFTDNMNGHTPFEDTIWNSNLCLEIALPTKAFKSMAELYNPSVKAEGEIALCFLSSIVAGRVKPEEYEEVAYYTLLMIDNVMDIMEYPYEALKKSAQYRRSVGVGITNLAHYLASNFTNYSSPKGKRLMHNLAELHSYSLHRASLRLAKERGVCEGMEVSKYRNGWTPLEDYSQEVDNIVDSTLQFDWVQLHKDIKANGGIRHSVLEAFMPNESSSLATSTTNGLYPIRELKMFKKSPQGSVFFLAPYAEVICDVYQSAWDVPDKDIIECYAIFQKFTGQAISADFYMDYHKTGNKVSAKEALQNLIYAHRLGMKTQYYMNSRVGVGETALQEIACDGCSL